MNKTEQLQIEQKPTEIKNMSFVFCSIDHIWLFCFQIDCVRPGISILSIKIAADKIRMSFSLHIWVQNHSGC